MLRNPRPDLRRENAPVLVGRASAEIEIHN
jgi:hypothetical protein